MSILQILNSLDADASRLAKEAIIRENKDNELFKLVLKAALDPQITFYLSKLPKLVLEEANSLESLSLEEAINDAIILLAGRKVTGNAARAWYDTTSASLSVNDRVVFERVIKKDLRCGVKESTVNTAFGEEFIYEHPNLLCSPFKDKDVEKLFKKNPWVYCQMKSDGARCQIVILEDKVLAYTRKGNLLDFRGRLNYLTAFPDLVGQVIDGELLTRTECGYLVDDRATCNGIINKLIQGTISDDELNRVFMTAWDIFPWENMKTKTPYKVRYEERFEKLKSIVESQQDIIGCLSCIDFFELIETYKVNSLEEAMVLCENWISSGLEGGVIKSPDLEWADKRDKNSIKIKSENDADLIVVGWEFGDAGKQFENCLGGLICETSDGKIVVTVGSGFSEDQRKNFLETENPDDLIGKIVEVVYNQKIKSKNKEKMSLFLPRFIRIRSDKDIANSEDEIK